MNDAAASTPRRHQGAILIVEDDPIQRMVYAAIAAQTGLDVIEAADARAALAVLSDAATTSPALLVLDVELGDASGLDVLSAVRRDPRHATLPVVLLTGHDDVDARIRGLRAGANDYVGKPAHPNELRARIEAQLRQTSSWRELFDDDLRQRSRLADRIAAAGASLSGSALHTAVVNALGTLPGAGRTDVLAVDEAGVHAGQVRSTGTARMLAETPVPQLHANIARGPWLAEPSTGEGLVCVPFTSPDGGTGLVVVQHDPTGGTSVDRLLSATIDAAAILAVIVGTRLLGTEATEQIRRVIDDVIRTRAFHPVYQPVVHLASGRTVGFEALTRFEGRGPDLVFADAARAGRSRELQRATILAIAEGASAIPAGCYLAINVSPEILLDPELGDWLPVGMDVVLEVTEHEQIDDYATLVAAARRLGPAVRLAVDDAGAGYASLHHILALAPDIVKLDRSIVAGIHASAGQEAMVAGLVHFASRTGAELIAEGVEEVEEAGVLRELGVQHAQGYLFGRPAVTVTRGLVVAPPSPTTLVAPAAG